ncbi:MAG: RnfABCDGE type electron transport complex subunit B [Oscillospiraceae bacterium]
MDIINAVWVLGAIGAVCAILLVLAAKFMHVPVDEKFPKIRECLPGANCGACGYAGCDGYASALASGEETKINKCVAGADKVAQALADALGAEFEDVVEQVAVVRCSGDCTATQDKMDYQGLSSCAAAKLLFGGKGACSFGCIGLGDCAKVCPEHAITVIDGLARVNFSRCIGCGMCTRTCPNGIITLMPDVECMLVGCSNKEKGAATRKECSKGCIGCHKCEKECPQGAITVVDNLSRIDYDKCVDCGHCAEVCPVGCIHVSNFSGAHRV